MAGFIVAAAGWSVNTTAIRRRRRKRWECIVYLGLGVDVSNIGWPAVCGGVSDPVVVGGLNWRTVLEREGDDFIDF